jgi:cytochrome c-type biogenesis protein CcmH
MTVFVLLGVLLALATLALLTRPLWRGPRDADAPPARSKGLLAGLAFFVCAVTVGGYAALGTPRAVDGTAAVAEAAATGERPEVTAAQIEALIEQLTARSKERPDEADTWIILGRALALLGRHEQALPALKRAVALRGNDAGLLTDYADALAVVNGRTLEGEPKRLIDRALELDPNHLKALSLAGAHDFNRKDYAGALRHWEKLAKLAPDNEMVQQVLGGIDEARKLAGATAAAPSERPTGGAVASAAPGATSVSGTVTLAPALAAKARPDDTLFVFARAVDGPRMPLAILRKQVKDLPLSFTLDDSMAMSPAARLSSAPRVVVGARISPRGDAMPQPGDLQGFSAPVAPGASGLKVQISEVIAAR